MTYVIHTFGIDVVGPCLYIMCGAMKYNTIYAGLLQPAQCTSKISVDPMHDIA